ncbi:DUF4381 domain-containing protein [Paraburkholderia bonniea]|uniref:DUF4381 domain-containing protein n=1 Tax=Paraburkholderia bonniea TaxID=2152891 RepID=UPI001291D163|nr:DUF4381 domain-containing protein [Paraburkholderia bonniea]
MSTTSGLIDSSNTPGSGGQTQALQELPLPEPVSYLPHTIGWLLVALVLAVLFALTLGALWRRRQKQRYRRLALSELRDLEARLSDPAQRAAALAAIPALLKRTALASQPRERVAALSGEDWLAFLQRTRGHFDAASGALLTQLSYADAQHLAAVSPTASASLVSHARDWIEHHHVEV